MMVFPSFRRACQSSWTRVFESLSLLLLTARVVQSWRVNFCRLSETKATVSAWLPRTVTAPLDVFMSGSELREGDSLAL